MICQPVCAGLTIAPVFEALRLKITWRAGADPFEVSLALLVEHLPRYVAQGSDRVAAFVRYGRELRFNHPSRRTVVQAPELPLEALAPLPPDLVLHRTPATPTTTAPSSRWRHN